MTKIPIPSGLLDENIEMFSAGTMMALQGGAMKKLSELPHGFLTALKVEKDRDPSVTAALTLAGYFTDEEQLEKYAECRFGGFDMKADYVDGRFSEAEYHECGFRGDCPMEGIVCDFFKVGGQIVTPFEIEMIKHLATEDLLPVIAEKLNVSKNTFESKKTALFQKLGVYSRPSLVAKAFYLQILNPAICSNNYQHKN
jgi:DNA-binding CsgD family transcriptional regulator